MNISPGDKVLIFLAVICLIGLIASMLIEDKVNKVKKSAYSVILQIVTWTGIIFLAVDLGWLGGQWLVEVQKPIRITSPYKGQMVNFRFLVSGKYKAIPPDQVLWLIVTPHNVKKYIPQPSPAFLNPSGSWS